MMKITIRNTEKLLDVLTNIKKLIVECSLVFFSVFKDDERKWKKYIFEVYYFVL